MKYYKLKKDLPTFKAGEKFRLEDGNLYRYESDNNKNTPWADWSDKIMVYHSMTLEKLPNILEDWFEEIEEDGVWEPKYGELYFNIEDNSVIGQDVWSNSPYDNNLYKIGNCFKTEKEVEKALDWLKAFKVLRDDTKGYKFKPWNDSYYAVYDNEFKKLVISFCNTVIPSPIFFSTLEDAEESIKKHEKEWKIFLGVEE